MARFELYRYQILPLDRFFQPDLYSDIKSIDEVLQRKNAIFSEAIEQTPNFSTPRTETVTRRLHQDGDFYLFRVAANRSIHRETKDFGDEFLDNWPSVLMGVWNRPDVQLVAIQKRTTAFQRTDILMRAVMAAVSTFLEQRQLRCLYEPLFEKQEFWKVIDDNEGKVQSLEFEFLTPNMANISKTLPSDLREFAKQTNSQSNLLKLKSDSEAALHVSKGSEVMNGLVDYSAEGGGNITVKIAGVKKNYQTSNTAKEIEALDVEMQGTAEEAVKALKALMN